jgi:hypothetical protein
VGDSPVGELNDQGSLTTQVYQYGAHNISIGKLGYDSQMFSGRNFVPGQTVTVQAAKLEKEAGFVLFVNVNPPNTLVRYKAAGDSEVHTDATPKAPLRLSPGKYDFTAEAAGYTSQPFSVTIERDKTSQLNIFLRQQGPIVVKPTEYVNPADVKLVDGWYTGNSKAFIPLNTSDLVNSIVFPKSKKVTFRIMLDKDSVLTYMLDSKGLSYSNSVGGVGADKKIPIDMSGTGAAASNEVVVIHLEPTGVRITKQDGTEVNKETDSKDWRRARLFVKGDAKFIVWPGR